MSEKGATLPPINDKQDGPGDDPQEKWVPKEWDFFKKTSTDLKKMAPQLRSRYQAYQEPPKNVSEAQSTCRQRLVELKRAQKKNNMAPTYEEIGEKDKHEKLIGQLKAAEARNRIRIMRLRYESNRAQEINHLISCQPTARKAVRLQALLPSKHDDRSQGDSMEKLQRVRVEALLEDSRGLITGRT